nr:hypothetical protein [uncultured bacterium]
MRIHMRFDHLYTPKNGVRVHFCEFFRVATPRLHQVIQPLSYLTLRHSLYQ